MSVEIVTSRQNQTIKRVRKLAQGRKPGTDDPAYVEGILPVLRAMENNVPFDLVVYAPNLLRSIPAQAAVAAAGERGVPCLAVSAEVFASFSERDNPIGLVGLVRAPDRNLTDLPVATSALYAVLHDVKNPGNLGTIIRTVDAAGGQGVVLLGQTADPFHPASIRASVGTVFAIPAARAASPGELFEWSRAHGVTVMATSAKAEVSLYEAKWRLPVAVLLGSEAHGLPSEMLTKADLAVSLPMYGQASSLNLAVAAGIILYEAQRHGRRVLQSAVDAPDAMDATATQGNRPPQTPEAGCY